MFATNKFILVRFSVNSPHSNIIVLIEILSTLKSAVMVMKLSLLHIVQQSVVKVTELTLFITCVFVTLFHILLEAM